MADLIILHGMMRARIKRREHECLQHFYIGSQCASCRRMRYEECDRFDAEVRKPVRLVEAPYDKVMSFIKAGGRLYSNG